MKKVLVAICLIVVVGFGAILLSNMSNTAVLAPAKITPDDTKTSESVQKNIELVIGSTTAPITIVEYSDYKCPKCNEFHQSVGKQLLREYVDTGKAKVIVRPYPLFGEDSGLALYASFCAAEQGKFAAYYNKMFDYMWNSHYKSGDYDAATQKIFSPEILGQLAATVGLDGPTFTVCAGGRTHAELYNAAVDKAAGDSVQGTPTLVIANQKIVGPQPYNVYKTLLDSATR